MKAVGKMDARILIYKLVSTSDGSGGRIVSRELLRRCWAEKIDVAGSEQLDYDRLNAVTKTKFRMRNYPDVSESDIIKFGGIEYNIRACLTDSPRDLYMVVECERGVPN